MSRGAFDFYIKQIAQKNGKKLKSDRNGRISPKKRKIAAKSGRVGRYVDYMNAMALKLFRFLSAEPHTADVFSASKIIKYVSCSTIQLKTENIVSVYSH